MWNSADLVRVSWLSQVGSGEFNYRAWNSAVEGFELILGVRWLGVRDRLSIFTDQLALTDGVDLLNQAKYTASTLNNLVTFQVGTEYSFPCSISQMGWIWFTGMGKAAIGPDFVQRNFSLSRGDGSTAFAEQRSDIEVGGVFELDAFVDFHLAERIRLRAGYQCLWATGISNPAVQASFNLANQGMRKLDSSSAFWGGPVAELELLW